MVAGTIHYGLVSLVRSLGSALVPYCKIIYDKWYMYMYMYAFADPVTVIYRTRSNHPNILIPAYFNNLFLPNSPNTCSSKLRSLSNKAE